MVRANDPEHFIVITLNHRTLSLKKLHRYAIDPDEFEVFLSSLIKNPSIEEVVGLSTCNRIEFFAAVHSVKDAAHAIVYPLAKRFGESLEELRPNLDVIVDAEGVEHLFRLVAGLESMVLGDAQILGQVKEAYKKARKRGHTKKVFNLLFQKAFANAKRVRTETGIGEGRVSVSAIAVEQALAHLNNFHSIVGTVIGAGKMGRLTAKYLRDAGLQDLRIINRNLERSQELADETGGTAIPFDQMETCISESHLIISGTSAPKFLITQAIMQRITRKHPQNRLLIDIALPPDIDPQICELPGITLIGLEDLREQAQKNESLRINAIKLAEEITGEELERLGPWPLPFHIDRFASHLGELADQICKVEIESLFNNLPSLTEEQKKIIKNQMERLAERMILAPRRNVRTHRAIRSCPNAAHCLAELFATDCGSRTANAKSKGNGK